jgi:hypothetical protein
MFRAIEDISFSAKSCNIFRSGKGDGDTAEEIAEFGERLDPRDLSDLGQNASSPG